MRTLGGVVLSVLFCAGCGSVSGEPDASVSADAAESADAAGSIDAAGAVDAAGATDAAYVPGSQTFAVTGAVQTWVVPAAVTSIVVDVAGARGGNGFNRDNEPDTIRGMGAQGGSVTATLPVTPNDTVYIYVGGAGANATTTGPGMGGYNGGGDGADSMYNPDYYGGGGGGASDLRIGGQNLTDRVVVAGGGGAGSGWCTNGNANGGAGGDLVGASGQMCAGTIGTGGTQTMGGSLNGALGVGGSTELVMSQAGSGGGGGYYGGGASDGSGAGGGSSYTDATATDVTHIQGGNDGDGRVVITW